MPFKSKFKTRRYKKGINSSKGVVGYIEKSKGNRFRVKEINSGVNFEISRKELKKAFVGDKVSCLPSSKGWVHIDKVLESKTKYFVGTISKHGKKVRAFPVETGRFCPVLIKGLIPKKLSNHSLVKVKVTRQPKQNESARGIIENILDSKDEVVVANEIAISKFNLLTDWPKGIIQETKKLTRKVHQKANKRKDLTKLPFVTIDGKNAKDFDDAVYAEKDQNGDHTLFVAIADVAEFVETGSYTDQEAKLRGTSVYFFNKVIPMLPDEISNNLCSLKPKQRRLCIVCKIRLNENGIPYESSFFESIIESKARITYEKAEKYFEEEDYPLELEKSFQNLKEIYKNLKKQKAFRSAIDLDLPAYIPKVVDGKVEKFIQSRRTLAHKVIEECMLLANISAANILLKSKIPSIFRIHPKPDYERVKQLESFVRSRKINIKLDPESKIKDFFELSKKVHKTKDKEVIHRQILRAMNLAKYSEIHSEHFALAYNAYSHFTSPIRRYPDLIVHRGIKALIKNNKFREIKTENMKSVKLEKNDYPFNNSQIEKIAADSSTKERLAEESSRDALSTLKCEVAQKNLGKVFQGVISEVTNFGIFVHISDLSIEGMAHIKFLSKRDYFEFDENSKSLIGKRTGRRFTIGDNIYVKILKVDISSQFIDLQITK